MTTITLPTVPTVTRTVTVATDAFDLVDVRLSDRGSGAAVLLLHGGAGTASVIEYADRLAAHRDVRVLVPTHPGFDGTLRPSRLTTIGGLAELYVALLDELGLVGVTVVGNSVGGWIAGEMGLLGSPRIERLVLVDAVGIEAPGFRIADVFSLTPAETADLSFHDPVGRVPDLSTLAPAARAAVAANRGALAVYAGQPAMTDPSLRYRLGRVPYPTQVVWGASDRIADPAYGRVYAAAIPGATFELLPATGHLPQLESPDLLDDVVVPPRSPAGHATIGRQRRASSAVRLPAA
jgi:pimeloyl-ACP methyl ester carboxylesterase